MGGRLVGGIGIEVVILRLGDIEFLRHRRKHAVSLQTIVATELHETQQQQRLLFRTDLSMQTGADGCHRILLHRHQAG